MKKTTTTCNYCGDGCQMYLETKDTEVIGSRRRCPGRTSGAIGADTAKGHGGLCARAALGLSTSIQRLD